MFANKLTLNIEKTEYTLIGSRQRLNDIQITPTIRLGDTEVNRVSEIKTLGIVVDDQLLWKNHVDATFAKISKGIGMLHETNQTLRTEIYFNACLQCPNFASFCLL